jgi:hypothetical protein
MILALTLGINQERGRGVTHFALRWTHKLPAQEPGCLYKTRRRQWRVFL